MKKIEDSPLKNQADGQFTHNPYPMATSLVLPTILSILIIYKSLYVQKCIKEQKHQKLFIFKNFHTPIYSLIWIASYGM
jgi:hypothetical protein